MFKSKDDRMKIFKIFKKIYVHEQIEDQFLFKSNTVSYFNTKSLSFTKLPERRSTRSCPHITPTQKKKTKKPLSHSKLIANLKRKCMNFSVCKSIQIIN